MGLHIYGQSAQRSVKTGITSLAAVILCLLTSLGASSAPADSYYLGPFPITLDVEGQKFNVWSSVRFTPDVSRDKTKLALRVTAYLRFDETKQALNHALGQRFPSDNCGRFGVDNWVYSFPRQSIRALSRKTLRVTVEGQVSTWTCADNPIPEVVWDGTGCRTAGVTHGCFITRKASPIKHINFEQGFQINKDFYAQISKDQRTVTLSEAKPSFIADGYVGKILTVLSFLYNTVPSVFSDTFSKEVMRVRLPDDLPIIHFSLEDFGFDESKDGRLYLLLSVKATLTLDELNQLMRNKFPTEWRNIEEPRSYSIKNNSQLKAWIIEQCRGQSFDINECAARMGYDFQALE